MAKYTIEQTTTAIVLFEGEAENEQHALDLMAREAGYADYASIPEEISGGDTLSITKT